MDKDILNKDKVWNRIKNYIYCCVFLIVLLIILLISNLVVSSFIYSQLSQMTYTLALAKLSE